MGIGVDIEDIERFREFDLDNAELKKIFTENELRYCFSRAVPAQHLAVRYSGKEAIIKALASLGRAGLDYRDIEITNDNHGVPVARIIREGFGGYNILLSLSHSKTMAVAFSLVTQRES